MWFDHFHIETPHVVWRDTGNCNRIPTPLFHPPCQSANPAAPETAVVYRRCTCTIHIIHRPKTGPPYLGKFVRPPSCCHDCHDPLLLTIMSISMQALGFYKIQACINLGCFKFDKMQFTCVHVKSSHVLHIYLVQVSHTTRRPSIVWSMFCNRVCVG